MSAENLPGGGGGEEGKQGPEEDPESEASRHSEAQGPVKSAEEQGPRPEEPRL